MAAAVGRALALDEALIVEAGTGTGKTFAYLVPALLSGRSVIISTGTRTLQDQLFRRDVPMLARALGAAVAMARLEGREAGWPEGERRRLLDWLGPVAGGAAGRSATALLEGRA